MINVLYYPSLGYLSPEEGGNGVTTDISNYLELMYYDPIFYYDKTETFPSIKQHLGPCLGTTTHFVDAMGYYILNYNNQVIDRSTVHHSNDYSTLNHRMYPTFMDKGGNK